MKKILFLFTFISVISPKLYSQEDIEVDILRAPSSPASNLLGISTTDIDKPTDISSFMVSLQSSSTSFTAFPSNYAIDFSPYYLFAKNTTDFTTEGLKSAKFEDIFKQTFVISVAVSNPDSTSTSFNYKSTYTGLGFKFSVLRGKYDNATEDNLTQIQNLQSKVNDLSKKTIQEYLESTDEYKELEEKLEKLINTPDPVKIDQIKNSKEYKDIVEQLSEKLKNFKKSEEEKKLFDKIKKIAADFQTQRIGFSWDVNGGASGEFRDRNFNNSKLFNAGIWTNFGYTTEKGFAFLGLVRYLYNPDKILALDNDVNEFENISTLDAGGRIAYSKSQSKFSCSIEAIYRSALNEDQIDPSWKMIFNADYSLFKNQKLTFTFGRDFDGTISKDGNLIAALTLIAGFGNKKITQPNASK